MPRHGRIEDSSSEGEEGEGDNYQPPSQSQARSQLTPHDLTMHAGLVCNLLMVNEQKKLPTKRQDIRKLVLEDQARHFPEIMTKATELMERVFGFKVKELEDKNYLLLNGLGVSGTRTQAAHTGLTTVILAAILMTDTQKMKENVMEEYLKALGVDVQAKANPVLGNVNKLIYQDMVREKYLEVSLDKFTDPPTKELRWGERAHLELNKKEIIELVCKIYGDSMDPWMWTTQWKKLEMEAASGTSTPTK
ncbi:hypothetical protein Pmani_033993 [Petrolisthes manimaculis]|uniref:MAGE domain-containing protein n=1 Tax=Petrolisthes manimaculis TaxID=1843537 RepID=A0AAE1TS25_9EUCA|nr:hypothetical protein Pmani_033993 [Petrolisthes manimaculis]